MSLSSNIYSSSIIITAGGTVQRVIAANTTPGAENNLGGPGEAIIVKARAANTSPLYLGNATTGGGANGSGLSATTGFELKPGDSVALQILGLGNAYIFGATTNDRYDILSVGG